MGGNIFLFYGEEDFLIREKVEDLKKGFSNDPLSLEQIDGEEPDRERITAALQTSPLLGGDKLVIIRHADLRMEEWVDIAPALRSIPSSTTLIIVAAALDRRSKIFKLIDEIGETCEFKSFADWEQEQVVAWVLGRAKRSGKKMEHEAGLRLREICGNRLYKLASEIEKLITYAGDKDAITAQDVEELASAGEVSSFALADAVAARDLDRALRAFRVLNKNRGDLFQILSLLATQYRTMLQIKGLGGAGKDTRKIAQIIGGSPYFVRKCLEKARSFGEEDLRQNLETLLAADLRLKSGESQPATFELMLFSLCKR